MTPQALLRATTRDFRNAGVPDPEVDGALLLNYVTGVAPLLLRLDNERVLTAEELSRFDALCRRRMERVPLQYLTHEQEFLGHAFYVDERVLIPRPETALLAEKAIAALHGYASPSALDLCCGSGCLCISLALADASAEVHGADLSPDALAVTRMNADRLHASITLHEGDLLDAVTGMTFDVIVSNPPYIPADDCRTLQPEVLREPAMALDGGGDGLNFYRRIAAKAPSHLNPGGTLLLEVGYGQAEDVMGLLTGAGLLEVAVTPDFQGIPRMVEARRA